jgi:FkbM family methyltransferase
VAIEIFALGEYASVVKNLPRLNTILDLGANVGMSMRYWREQYPSAIIVGVEPDRDNARICRKNARAGGGPARQTFVIRGCAGGASRIVSLNRSMDAYAFSMGDDLPSSHPVADSVKVFTIPELLACTQIEGSIDLLKCDIEGGERELFEHCREWINKVDHMIVEVHPPYSLDDLVRALLENGASFDLLENVDKGGGLRIGFFRQRVRAPSVVQRSA